MTQIDIERAKETALLATQYLIDSYAASGLDSPRFQEFHDRLARGEIELVVAKPKDTMHKSSRIIYAGDIKFPEPTLVALLENMRDRGFMLARTDFAPVGNPTAGIRGGWLDRQIARQAALDELVKMVEDVACHGKPEGHDFRAFLHDRLGVDCGQTFE